MIIVKTERDLQEMRPACRLAAVVLDEVAAFVQPGVTTRMIDQYAADRIQGYGARSAFLGYRGYPCHLCISVNEQVVHGLATDRRVEFGDIVSLDVGVVHNGFIGDTARTVPVGGCGLAAQRLLDVTEQSLYEGINAARVGSRVADISRAVQQCVERNGYNVVREFVGHGVGRSMHEDPQVPNYVETGRVTNRLKPGMTIAIEPMVNAGGAGVKVLKDGWTVVTEDGQLSAHFEHTVLITEQGPEILTCHEKTASKLRAG
jgi:methionyl aminopeptidase